MQSPHLNPFIFYATASASFLESRVDTYVENLEAIFAGEQGILAWLRDIWLPEESEHGRLLKNYVEGTWPRFDWNRGFTLFSTRYIPRCDHSRLRPSPGLEALARCATETGASMIYRCIGAYAIDPELKALMRRISTDEVRHFRHFRDIHQHYDRTERRSFLCKARIMLARALLVRSEDLALSFEPLNGSWNGAAPFVPWSYADFLAQTARVMRVHFPHEQAARMLTSPLRTGSITSKYAASILATLVNRQFLHFRDSCTWTSRKG